MPVPCKKCKMDLPLSAFYCSSCFTDWPTSLTGKRPESFIELCAGGSISPEENEAVSHAVATYLLGGGHQDEFLAVTSFYLQRSALLKELRDFSGLISEMALMLRYGTEQAFEAQAINQIVLKRNTVPNYLQNCRQCFQVFELLGNSYQERWLFPDRPIGERQEAFKHDWAVFEFRGLRGLLQQAPDLDSPTNRAVLDALPEVTQRLVPKFLIDAMGACHDLFGEIPQDSRRALFKQLPSDEAENISQIVGLWQ